MNARKKQAAAETGVSWWKPVVLTAVLGALVSLLTWIANTGYQKHFVKPEAPVNAVKGELSQPLSDALNYLKRVNAGGDPVGHLAVSSLRKFVNVADADEDNKKLDLLPSALHARVLHLAHTLESSGFIMPNRDLASYSTPDGLRILNEFQPEIHSVWVDLTTSQ